MKLLFRFALAASLASSLVGFASAQGQRYGGQQQNGGQQNQGRQNRGQNRQAQMAAARLQNALDSIAAQSDPLQLVFRKDVQHDLLMDLGQRNKFDNLHDRQIQDLQQTRLRNLRNMAAVLDLQVAQKKEVQEKIDTLLEDKQKARLNQLVVQIQGNAAVFSPDIRKGLGITDEQWNRLSQIKQERESKIAQLINSVAQGEVVAQDMNTLVNQIQTDMNSEIGDALTPEQVAQLKKLQGAPFKAG